jgi:hypothetical protein
MEILFIILGAAFVLSMGALMIKRKLAPLLNPPTRISLEPVTETRRRDPAADQMAHALQMQGFDEMGTWRVPEIPGLVLTGFTQKFQVVCSVVYEHPLVGVFADAFSENEDGVSLTVTNAPAGGELDTPPNRDKIVNKEWSVDEIYDVLLRQRPRGPHRRIDERNFVEEFERAYALEMDWRVNRGVSEDEVRRTAANMGGGFSDRNIRKATEKLNQQYAEKRETVKPH